MGGAYFDYDETALADKTDPSPFREGKVRTSVGGPGHFNSSPFNRALRLPQYIAPPEEYKDLIVNLEKQVAELREENIRLKNIMLISSPKALYHEYEGGKASGLMSPGGKLIYESPNRKSPIKRTGSNQDVSSNQEEEEGVHSEEEVDENLTSGSTIADSEIDLTSDRTVESQQETEQLIADSKVDSSSAASPSTAAARPILNLTNIISQSPPTKKKSYMSALTSPLKRENKVVYQSLSPYRHSSSNSVVGRTDLQFDLAEDRREPSEEFMSLLKNFQDSISKYGPNRQEVIRTSIKKS